MEGEGTVPCDGISYDPGKRTLTLDGFSPKRDSDFQAVLYIGFPGFLKDEDSHDESLFEKTMHEPIKIKLLGNNTISASNVQFGIVSFCPLIIEGSGSLNIDVEGIINYDCFGIIALGGISITGGTVTSYAKAKHVPEKDIPIAAGVVIANGELELKEKMRLFCGDKAPGEEKTARDFNALMKKAIDGDDPSLFPAYFHTEMIPEEKKEETPAARPAPELPEGKFILTARCKVYKDGNAKGRKLKHKMAFTWNESRNVDGYDLFLKSCKDKNAPFEIAATVMTGNPCKVDLKNLKKHKAYKAYVKPFVINNGVKEYVLEATPRVHFYTAYGNKKGTRLTPTKLTVSEKQRNGITLDIGGKKKIRTTIKVKKGKNGKPVAHVNRRRYYSTNEAVAKVNSKGKVTGVAPGTCKIYILTNNGIYQTVDVTVTEKTAKKKK